MFKNTSDVTDMDLAQLPGIQSTRKLLTEKHGLSTSISESLGALVIGVLVLAGIGVGIGAAYNYSQDSNAKSSLEAVKSAEVLYQAKNAAFGDVAALTGGNDPALSSSAPNVTITATTINYCAVVKSGSMFTKNYWVSSVSGKILDVFPSTVALGQPVGVTCPTA